MAKMKSVEHRIADAILDDILDRRGLKQAFEEVDEETRWEIQSTWVAIIRAEIIRTPDPLTPNQL